jgi:hypothetical protein
MLPGEYDLRVVQERYVELRRESSAYRLAQAYRLNLVPGPSLLDRVRALFGWPRLTRPVAPPANAAA